MRFFRVLLALSLLVGTVRAAEITTDDGKVIKDCEIVSITPRAVVYQKVGQKQAARPINKVLEINFRDVNKIPADKSNSLVELTDGTVLVVSKWAIKKTDLEMTLLSGPTLKTSLKLVASILNNAKEEKDRNDWRNRVIHVRGREGVVLKRVATHYDKKLKKAVEVRDENGNRQYVIYTLEVVIGEGDPKGETIELAYVVDDVVKRVHFKQKELHGLIYKHALDAKAPPIVCKLVDTTEDVVMASKLEAKEGGVVVTTPAGVKMEFLYGQIATIDYTPGRLDYLSSLQPAAMTITLNPFDQKDRLPTTYKWFVYKDSNLQGRPITLGGTPYRHGLTLLPDVELVYNLGGAYRRFEAIIGIDDETKAEGEGVVEVWGNNRKLASVEIVSRTALGKPVPHKKMSLNVAGVLNLRIIFKAKNELSGLSISASLGDAKVIK